MAFQKRKRERELSNWNKIIGVTYFFLSKKNLQTIIWGFWPCFEWGSLEEPLTLVIKVIFQAFNLQKILWICQDNLWVFSHNGTNFSWFLWIFGPNYGFLKRKKKVERREKGLWNIQLSHQREGLLSNVQNVSKAWFKVVVWSPGSLGRLVVHLLGLQYSGGSWWHAVDRPICVSMFVTDGNGESSIVCSYHWDGFSNITRNVQLLILTTVTSLVLGSIWSLTYKEEEKNELQTQKAAKVAKQEKGRMRKEGLKNELPLHFWQTLIFYFLYFLDSCSTYFLLDHPNYPFLLEKHLQHTCLFVDKHNIQSISQHIEMNHFGLKIP